MNATNNHNEAPTNSVPEPPAMTLAAPSPGNQPVSFVPPGVVVSLTILAPANGATISGPPGAVPISISMEASSSSPDYPVSRVRVKIDNGPYQDASPSGGGGTEFSVSSSSEFSLESSNRWSYLASATAERAYSIVARAEADYVDSQGNNQVAFQEVTRTVTVQFEYPDTTAPTVSISRPANNAAINVNQLPFNVTIAGTAADPANGKQKVSGVQQVEYSLNGGAFVAAAFNAGNWSAGLAPAALGSYTVRARTRDNAGNLSAIASVAFSLVNTGAAMLTITTKPAPTDIISGSNALVTVTLKGATQNVSSGVKSVQWSLDSGTTYQDATRVATGWAQWSADVPVPTPAADEGPAGRQITLRCTDNDGNQTILVVPFKVRRTASTSGTAGAPPSALSPSAYLADLIDFLLGSFEDFYSADRLAEFVYRPLSSLPLSPAAAETPIHQVVIAIEVLERYVLAHQTGLTRDQLYINFNATGSTYPRPNALGRLFDLFLGALQTTRTELRDAFRLAYPSGAGNRAPLDALLARVHLVEADFTGGLGLTIDELKSLDQLRPRIGTIDDLPALVRKAQTYGIGRNNPIELPAYTDALARAEAAIDRVKEYGLADVRANLIQAALAIPDPVNRNAKELGNNLCIDLATDATLRTTRVADAIEALQSLMLIYQLGRRDFYAHNRDNFNLSWRWMQSYSLWHAAQSVFLYSENFLMARTRRTMTPEFRALLDTLETQPATSGIRAAITQYSHEAFQRWSSSFDHACVFGNKLFTFNAPFRWNSQTSWSELRYATLDEFGNWTGWQQVPVPQDALNGQRVVAISVVGDKILFVLSHYEDLKTTLMAYAWGGDANPAVRDEWSHTYAYGQIDPVEVILDPYNSPYPDFYVIAAHVRFKSNNGKSYVNTWFRTAHGSWSNYYSWLNVNDAFPVDGMGVRPGGWLNGKHYALLTANNAMPRLVSAYRTDPSGLRQPSMNIDKIVDVPINAYACAIVGPYVVVFAQNGNTVEFAAYHVATGGWMDKQTMPIGAHSVYRAVFDGDYLFIYDSIGLSRYRRGWTQWPSFQYEWTSKSGQYATWPQHMTERPIDISSGDAGFAAYVQEQQQFLSQFNSRDLAWLYAEEYYMHVPLAVAEYLNQQQSFQEADTWLHLLYHPFLSPELRLVYPILGQPGDPSDSYRDTIEWLRDPFNPFKIGRIRDRAFLRHVLQRHIANRLDWADAEFVRDTSESIGRARELYELAEDLLETNDLAQDPIEAAWRALSTAIYARYDAGQVRIIQLLLAPARRGNKTVSVANIQQFGTILRSNQEFAPLDDEEFVPLAAALKQAIDNLPNGPSATLASTAGATARPASPTEALLEGVQAALRLAAPGLPALSADAVPAIAPETRLVVAMAQRIQNGFGVPENPQLDILRWRVASNLEKIRNGRNYTGLRRQLQTYTSPADPLGLILQAGDQTGDGNIPDVPPPVYRFSYLIERARYFATTAQQLEALLLASFEKSDQEAYNLLKARQDLRAAGANIALQSLRVKEAGDGIELARRQFHRSEIQLTYFSDLIGQALLDAEKEALERLWVAHDWTYAATITSGIGTIGGAIGGAAVGAVGGPPGSAVGAIVGGIAGAITGGGQVMRDIASINSIASQARSLQATYERRAQEWQFQRQLADQDLQIGSQQITLSADQLAIVQQEASIAQLQNDFASEVVNFLGAKFTNKELYDWMVRVVRGYYRDHLNFATVTARMAQQALAFERQETITYIAPYYAEREKRDLLMAERLLTDINRLDQHRLTTERRRKELTKTISLASYAPVEFQRLRSQGWLSFATLMDWFDRDFPGHYMRLIKSVSMTVIGLIPPTEGIKATLSNTGISQVMVGPPFDQLRTIQRQPESIAVTAPNNGTGLFELRFDDPILLPFEGSGVASTWTLELPKGANRFDYATLLDILVTINYTALDDAGYRDRVVQQFGTQVDRMTSFAIRNSYPDAWYQLHNPTFLADPGQYGFGPGQVPPPYALEFALNERDFAPNEPVLRMLRLTLAQRHSRSVKAPIALEFLPDGTNDTYRSEANINDPASAGNELLALTSFSRRRTGSGAWQAVTTPLGTLKPFGRWRLWFRNDSAINPANYPDLFSSEPPVYGQRKLDLSWLNDTMLVVGYTAEVDYTFAS